MEQFCCKGGEVQPCAHARALGRSIRPALQTGSGLRLRAFRKRTRRRCAGHAERMRVESAMLHEAVPAYPARGTLSLKLTSARAVAQIPHPDTSFLYVRSVCTASPARTSH